jgi:TPR repeat protein
MRRLLIAIALVFTHAAWSGDFEDGLAAYNRKDYTTALKKFRSAAQQGNAAAQTNLGKIYEQGEGVAQDYKEAVRWYHFAARQGIAIAQYNLGLRYQEGEGVKQDYSEAARLFRLAAESGHEEAQLKIASLYLIGYGVPKSYLLAYMWSYIALEGGNNKSKNLNKIAAERMTLKKKEQAQRMARECIASNFTKCD